MRSALSLYFPRVVEVAQRVTLALGSGTHS